MKDEYTDWIANRLESWAETFDTANMMDNCDDEKEQVKKEELTVWDELHRVAKIIREGKPLDSKDSYFVMFHLWQIFYGTEEQ